MFTATGRSWDEVRPSAFLTFDRAGPGGGCVSAGGTASGLRAGAGAGMLSTRLETTTVEEEERGGCEHDESGCQPSTRCDAGLTLLQVAKVEKESPPQQVP